MHESSCCFANLNPLLFRRSPCRHRRRCLSSLLVEVKEQKNAEAEVVKPIILDTLKNNASFYFVKIPCVLFIR